MRIVVMLILVAFIVATCGCRTAAPCTEEREWDVWLQLR